MTPGPVALAALALLALAAPGPGFAAETSKACQTAKNKVERERRSLAAANDTIARDKHARETCVSRSACARYDAALADLERRSARIVSRLARFEAEVASTCN